MTEQLDRNALKKQALLEKVAQLTAQYEDQVSDLRVELTLVMQDLEAANARVAELEEAGTKNNG